jgi:hypothetical protein
VFGRGPRLELHVHGPGGTAVARELLACIEVAVVQGPLDGLSSPRPDAVAGSSH